MTTDIANHVARLAFNSTVLRAVHALPQHQPIAADERFNELLNRLSQSEQGPSLPVHSSPATQELRHDHR